LKRPGITRFLLIWLSASVLPGCPSAVAQQMQRPDAGTLQEPQRQIPLLPQPGAPPISLPEVKPPVPGPTAVRITPAAFRFEGNTVFDGVDLAALLAERVNQPTDLAGLTEAAGLVSRYYRARGYLLTEAYLPEQAFQAAGGTVTIAVVEARVGKVHVRVEGDKGSSSYVRRVVTANLAPGVLITEYLLDKPVLLLRDLAGIDASATVAPGDQAGQADVTVTIRSQGLQVDGSAGADNFGAGAAGPLHLVTDLHVSNLLGRGDVFSARGQTSDASDNKLYRLAYTVPVDAAGTRLALSAAHTDYALGKQFAALGASGKADILGISLTRPLIRSRENNLYGQFSLEHKKFSDAITTPANESERRIISARVGLLGNFADAAAGTGGPSSSTSYALSTTLGRAKLDAASLALDQGAGGLQTAGGFNKLNLEFQRVQFFGDASSILVSLQAQLASKNLASAEKMALGGPAGVRGYPVGEGIGDAGLLLNMEYRYQLPASMALAGEPVSLAVFYDYGTVKFNQDNPALAGTANRIVLGSVGIGVLAGRVNHFLITTYLAWRSTHTMPSTGDPDRSPRVWVSVQKWF
jgi:hemolysin activation/secretion protein